MFAIRHPCPGNPEGSSQKISKGLIFLTADYADAADIHSMTKGEGMTKPNYQIHVIRVIHGSAPLLVFIRVNVVNDESRGTQPAKFPGPSCSSFRRS